MNVSNARPFSFYCDCGVPSNLLGFTLLPVSLEYRTGGLDPHQNLYHFIELL